MKVGLVAKLDKRNKTTSKKIRDDMTPSPKIVTSLSFFQFFGQFGAKIPG